MKWIVRMYFFRDRKCDTERSIFEMELCLVQAPCMQEKQELLFYKKLEIQEIAVVFPCSTYSLVKQEQHKDTCLPDSNEGNKDNRRKENCKMFFPKQTNTTVDCVPVFYSKLVIYPSTHCLVNMLHKVAASGLRSWYLQPQTAANHKKASSS